MMLKLFTMVTGISLLLIGLLGFVPALSTTTADDQQMLFGLFMVGLFHNVFHLASGMVGFFASRVENYARWYLRIFGSVYAVLAVLGLTVGINNVNIADHLLHAGIAALLLWAGFAIKSERSTSMSSHSLTKQT
ncbi:MAG: DUF4383 domain-containing protein [Chloroflexi bacterium]|nr:DUF4383 domain-containing protein [Chloroflexota bacterium]